MLKKILLTATFLFVASLFATQAQAQTVVVTIFWDPSPASELVTDYIVTLNGTQVPGWTCTATLCSVNASLVLSSNTHLVTVSAVNDWGTGPAYTLSFLASAPTAPKNVKVKKAGS